MQTADLQTRTWVSQTSTPVSQNSTSVRLFRLAISDGNGNTIYNLPVCKSAVCICCTPLRFILLYLGLQLPFNFTGWYPPRKYLSEPGYYRCKSGGGLARGTTKWPHFAFCRTWNVFVWIQGCQRAIYSAWCCRTFFEMFVFFFLRVYGAQCKLKAIRTTVYMFISRPLLQGDIWQDHKFHFSTARQISSQIVSGSSISWFLSNISCLRFFSLLVVRLLSDKTSSCISQKLVGGE